jgi:2-oxoisovalerate dehydrogenase E1 component alpha subunit
VQVIKALQVAQDAPKAPLSDMFTDVYDQLPLHLQEQRAELFDFVSRHPDACPPDIPVK